MICAPGGPALVSWNVTLRCPLKCAHCYADAGENEAEGVLSTDEAFSVIDQIAATGKPVVVLSGGEPLLREDIFEIARYGTERGLVMAMGTSGYLLDHETAERLREAGIRSVAISIDSVDSQRHDAFRGVAGVWERAVAAIKHCRDAGIDVRINMTVMRPLLADVEAVLALGESLGVRDYQVFFPVETGRARGLGAGSPGEYETLIREILVRYRKSDLRIRPTCAPQFRRIADEAGIENSGWSRGCLAAISYCRIYATGEVTPCPYLPVSAGNVRTTPFHEIWYNSDLFSALRDPDRLTGKCGRCDYRTTCGGCRARAYRGADTVPARWCDGLLRPDDPCGEVSREDPWCRYEPRSIDRTDLAILDALQDDLPLVPRPWAAIAAPLGITENELLARMQRLHVSGILRNVSPVFESRRFGLATASLIALRVPEDRVREVAGIVNGYPEVSHNFRRDHPYALWFTLAAPTEDRLDEVLADILARTGISGEDVLNLPTVQAYKIDVRFRLFEEDHGPD
ncbi:MULTISPECIES: radical SAM/SPASM domain-containing protein [unclassified Methanoculleus]|uniref:Radical SAM protein n=1 Tax=Methanoculleus palmolei TaxID=72612 RepID=A0ABD8AAL5_9EURY|nr:radical SAM protein [Methanoculleus sp. UBA377]WOX55631.1 radical SAM protein [Methanoculleus palmolei]